ncbi:MAG: NUDIX hydrolase, partial [Nitrosomonadales bacterium]|nr:NUDIX hydrolase [Nitrosomonadales bacterium]
LRSSENAETALKRELLEEAMIYLNQKKISPHQIGFYSDPKRDEYNFESKNPSFHKQIMSVAYAAILNEDVIPFAGSDAAEAEYFYVKDILNKKIEKRRLAFDHNLILDDAINYISEKMKFTPIALDFLDEEFTIGEIRSVYEAIWSVNEDLDNIDLSNFHKKVLNQTDQDGNYVILPSPQSKNKKRKQPGKGAPAKLYIRNEKSREFSLVMSPTKKRQ